MLRIIPIALLLGAAPTSAQDQRTFWEPIEYACGAAECANEDGDEGERTTYLPTERGEQYRISGATGVGFSYGASPSESAVVWEPSVVQFIRVPLTSSATYLVARGDETLSIARRSVRTSSQLLEASGRGLTGLADPGDAEDAVGERIARELDELRRVFPDSSVRSERFFAARRSRMYRAYAAPLRQPYLVRVGSREAVVEEGHRFESEYADITSLKLQAFAGVPASIEVFANGYMVARESWNGTESGDPLTKARIVRYADSNLAIRVLTGRINVKVVRRRERRRLVPLHRGGTARLDDFALALSGDHDALTRVSSWSDPETVGLRSALSVLYPVDVTRLGEHLTTLFRNRAPVFLRLLVLQRMWSLKTSLPRAACEGSRSEVVDTVVAESILEDVMHNVMCSLSVDGDALLRLGHAAASHPADVSLGRFIRFFVRRLSTFSLHLSSEQAPPAERVLPPRRTGQCSAFGPMGWRWSQFPPGVHRLLIPANERTKLMVSDGSLWQGSVSLGQVPVPIHGALGLVSEISLPDEVATVAIPAGAPNILVRLRRPRRAPCRALRDVFEGEVLGAGVEYTLEHGSETIPRARVSWITNSPSDAALELTLDDGLHARTVTIPPGASHAMVEVPYSRQATTIQIAPGSARHGDMVALRGARSRRLVDMLEPPEALRESQTVDEALSMIRESSRILERTGVDNALDHRAARAGALEALGYRRLAREDRRRLEGRRTVPTLRIPSLEEEEVWRNHPARFLAQPVVDAQHVAEAREHLTHNNPSAALAVLHPHPQSADALLRGLLLEREEQWRDAGRVFSVLGGAESQSHAAMLISRAAVQRRSAHLAVEAYAFETLARLRGARPRWHRGFRAVDWRRPRSIDDVDGHLIRLPRTTQPTLGQKVRRAWLDAPQDAVLLGEGRSYFLQVTSPEGTQVELNARCRSPDTHAPCSLTVLVDAEEQASPLLNRRSLDIPAGSHRVRVRAGQAQIGYVHVEPPSEGVTFTPGARVRAFRVDADAPLRFAVVAPSILRVTAVEPGPTTPTVHVAGVETAPYREDTGELRVPILGVGEQTVEVHTRYPRDVRVAWAVPGPFPEIEPRNNSATTLEPPTLGEHSEEEHPPIADEEVVAGRFSFVANTRVVFAEVRDLDIFAGGAPYYEHQAAVGHTRNDRLYHIGLAGWIRLRGGRPSTGLRGRFRLAADGWRPRVLLSGQVAYQREIGASVRGALTVGWTARVHPLVQLQPYIGASFAHVPLDGVPEARDIDADIFTRYDRDHPNFGRFGLILRSRPFLDLRTRVAFSGRTNSGFAGLDRLGGRVDFVFSPGVGYVPLVSLGYELSYRFEDPFRPLPIIRHILRGGASIWRWTAGESRWMLSAQAEWIMDRTDIAGFLDLQYTWSPRRGAHDLDGRATSDRRRLEEDARIADELGTFTSPHTPWSR